ncbi:uncharacterized protein LOC121341352 [Onychostruthus taczanowskii]|uniref:uncharacterized protein LOC121341352 n=1 Tax=Onychostruthus taczanowskii TaxID=356909 RepID=UPI001B80077E|nr:uncharacterized protein LOC121341352 [Onychostruthus taczanowskii]XP_041270733.1 uncharacterized protein LOC121341352 [Onychostruthus taczanowskii]
MRVVAAVGCSVPAADTRTAGPVTRTVAKARTAAVRGESAQVVRKVPARARRGDRIRGSDKRSASGSGGRALRTRTGHTKPRKWNWEGFFTFCKLTRTQALWDMLPLAAGVGTGPGGTSPSGEPAGAHPKRDRGCAGPGEGVPFHTPGMTRLRLCRSRRRRGAVRHSSRHCPVTVARQPQQPAHGSNSHRRLRETGQESSSRSEWKGSENFHSALSSFLGKKRQLHRKSSQCYTGHFIQLFHKPVPQNLHQKSEKAPTKFTPSILKQYS